MNNVEHTTMVRFTNNTAIATKHKLINVNKFKTKGWLICRKWVRARLYALAVTLS